MKDVKYAGFWVRILSGIVDGILLLPLEFTRLKFYPNSSRALLFEYFIVGVYYVFFWRSFGATVGMMLFKLKLIPKDMKDLTVTRAIVRYVGLQISAFTIIGGLWMLWDKHKQMWHDKFARTYVIKK
ncbi:MAG: RDD family protein [Nitrospirota bacterium]